MNNLWRRIRNRKSSSKSSSDKNETRKKPQEPEPEKNETQNKLQESKPTRNELVLLGSPAKRFDLEDVLRASKQVLGKGTFGTTYKTDLEDGTTTVILKMLENVVLSAQDFRDKVEAISAMDHENLLPLRGYFYSKDMKFLLYDYMPRESLSGRLHTYRRWGGHPLSWEVRLLIAVGAARAIEHLHAQSHPIIHHGNIKSSKVLLTPSYEARVSDYGLIPLTRPTRVGDPDPKVADVYGFGQLLLELLIGEPYPQLFLEEQGRGTYLPQSVQVALRNKMIANIFNGELMTCREFEEGMVKLLKVAISCVCPYSRQRPTMSEARRKIEELNNTYIRKPPDGILKVSERVYVLDCCLTVDGLNNEDHQILIEGVVAKVRWHFPDAFFKVFNFGEQESHNQMTEVLSYMRVKNYPIQDGDCPILTMEMIHLFLRSADAWLSREDQRCMLLMHCERGGWPVLAFMLAALLLYRKKSNGEEETLHLMYKKAPSVLLHLISPLNPLPSQLRYLHYISTSNVDSEGRPPDRALTLDSVILRSIPCLDAEVGYLLMFTIYGHDSRNLTDKTPTVLFSTPERGKDIRHYKQADCKRVTVDIHCPVHGDVVLECMSRRAGRINGETMFRVMFNTAYLRKNVLKLKLHQMDVPWDRQDQYSREFSAMITFSEMNPAASLVSVHSSGDEEHKENQLAKGAKKIEAQEMRVDDQEVYSALLSQYANTSQEDNEVREWPIQSDTFFPTSILLPTLSSQLEASVYSALDGSLASSDSASSSLSQDRSPVSCSAILTKKNIEPLQSPKQQLVSSPELSQDVHSVSVDSPGDEEQTENHIAKGNRKIEARDLQVKDQAVYSARLSGDANTSNEENEVREWPIQSNTASSTSILLPMLPSQLELSANSALDGSLASSDSASCSLNPKSDPQFLSGPPPPPTSVVSRTPPSSLYPDLTPPPTAPPPHVPLLLDTTLLNEGEMLNLPNDNVSFCASGAPGERVLPSFKLFQNGSLTEKNIEFPEMKSSKQQPVSSLELSQDVRSGDDIQFHEWKEGITVITATNMEITSGGDCESSSAVSSDSIEATKELVHNSAQIPEMKMLQEEKPCQLDGVASSTSMSSGYDYDIFLSFRGPDTRSGITDFLSTSLLAAGIQTFRDDEELQIGKEIGPELLKAINHSKISIPIFSKGYAFSKWCLSELAQMVECMKSRRQKIMPIFYDVTPSEVRHQTGSYGDAFVSHEKQFDNEVISKWKAALKEVGGLKGWDIHSMTTRREGELVKLIVEEVIAELKRAYLPVTDCLVGIEHHVKEINTMLCGDSKDIQIVGIYGMGGVGKSTLAKIIYNQLLHRFEDCCFLSNVRETSQLKGIECLQNQLISDILKKKWSNISNVEEGIKMIKERLCSKKVLVLLDDVDQLNHWDALIGKPAWFGLGSRIIITSRNKDIVDVPEGCYPYELMSMNFNQSLQLFCKHAFGRDYPSDDYVAFSTEVVKSTGGLPLALEAIGKLLPRRSKDIWDVVLKKLKQVPLNEVKRKLKLSYDALDDWQKHIFLDIACLFTGFDQKRVLHLWKDSNLFPEEGLEVLQKMSLIKIGEDNKLWMHDQLKGLGRDIVRRECDKEREKQTWLWNHEEGLDMVMETKGTKKIEALCRKFDPHLLYHFANEDVERPSNLRYPEVRVFQENWPSNNSPSNLQNTTLMHSKLRWLSWHYFPLEVKITNFYIRNIVILYLGHCPNLMDIQSIEGLVSLRLLKLIEIPLLERLPDLSNLKKLNELHLEHCHNIIDLQSIEGLENLRTLKFIEIRLLKRLPDLSNLKKLTELHLRCCHGLTEIKSFEGLENLMMLKLGELPLLERLPNLSNLKKLTQLDLRRCHNLVKVQGRLESLEDLCIQGCRSLDEVLDPASSFRKLKSLRIHDCEKLHLDRIWVPKFEISDRVFGNSTCLLLSKIGICVCQLGRQFFLPSLP